MNPQVLIEAISVGATLALALGLVFILGYAPTTLMDTLIVGFIVGCLIHLGFEVLGFNAWYCKYGSACAM